MFAILSLSLTSHKKHSAAKYAMLQVGSTLIAVALSILLTRIRKTLILVAVCFSVVFRGLIMIFITPKLYEGMTCQPHALNMVRSILDFVLFLAEASMFRNLRFYIFTVPVSMFFFLFATIWIPNLPICNYRSFGQISYAITLGFFLLIPLYASFYMQAIADLRFFVVAENNSKQQRLILEIFEHKNEGVVLIKN